MRTAHQVSGNGGMASEPRESFIMSLFLFLLGLSSSVTINVVGTLPVPELILSSLCVIYLFDRQWTRVAFVRWTVVLIVVWLATQVLTDRIREIPVDDSMRGIARIFTFGAALVSLWFLMANRVIRMGAFSLGIAFSLVVRARFFPTTYMIDAPWKFAYGPAITFFCIGLLCYFSVKSRLVWGIVLAGLGVVHFLLNARSLGGSCLLPMLLILGGMVWNRVSFRIRFILATGGAIALLFLYGILAGSGVLGEAARTKFESQKGQDGSFITVLLAGRNEHRASFKAISDSPFLGFGSWARHPEYYSYTLSDEDIVNKKQITEMAELGIIPSHSHIMGAWVDGGPVPGLIWVAITIILFVRYLRINVIPSAHALFALYFGVGLMWSIAFSPLGVGQRVSTAFGFVVIFSAPIVAGGEVKNRGLARLRHHIVK